MSLWVRRCRTRARRTGRGGAWRVRGLTRFNEEFSPRGAAVCGHHHGVPAPPHRGLPGPLAGSWSGSGKQSQQLPIPLTFPFPTPEGCTRPHWEEGVGDGGQGRSSLLPCTFPRGGPDQPTPPQGWPLARPSAMEDSTSVLDGARSRRLHYTQCVGATKPDIGLSASRSK